MSYSKAEIIDGIWTRYIPYFWGGRTSMFKTVLSDPRLREAQFICNRDGTRVFISADELRRLLLLGNLDYRGKWTFTINSRDSKIEGWPVTMRIV